MLAIVLTMAIAAIQVKPAYADSIRDQQWHLSSLDIARAERISNGAGVTVAVIDTGVDASHRDLSDAVLPGIDLVPGSAGDGRRDVDGHGTEMAGIIAGRGHGSGAGVLGIAPGAMVLPIRAPVGRYTTTGFMASAVDFAIAKHARVINMSFTSGDDATLRGAIRKALAADIVLVAGSGNKGEPGEYPGKYPEVVTVGAVGRDGRVASFSAAGPQVDLVAPGVDIVTTTTHAGYYTGQGTSAATAVVSGAAALLRSKYPALSAAEIVHRLTATAVDVGPPGRDDAYGFGRLDIVRALTADVTPLPSSAASGPAPSGAPAPTPPVGTSDLPKPASPLLLAAIVAGVVLLVGVVVIVLMVRRGRRSAG